MRPAVSARTARSMAAADPDKEKEKERGRVKERKRGNAKREKAERIQDTKDFNMFGIGPQIMIAKRLAIMNRQHNLKWRQMDTYFIHHTCA